MVTVAETTEESPAQARTGAGTLTRDDEAARTPPEQCHRGGRQSPDSPAR